MGISGRNQCGSYLEGFGKLLYPSESSRSPVNRCWLSVFEQAVVQDAQTAIAEGFHVLITKITDVTTVNNAECSPRGAWQFAHACRWSNINEVHMCPWRDNATSPDNISDLIPVVRSRNGSWEVNWWCISAILSCPRSFAVWLRSELDTMT